MGAFLDVLGLRYSFGSTSVSGGKVSPVCGQGWDAPAGFFGTTLAEDYEMREQIGIFADFDLGTSGVLSGGVFFADDTALSRSAGFKRGRNTTAAGGAGNTGKLDNFVIAWNKEMGGTAFNLGARFLSAGVGDVDDETGFVAGASHDFGNGFEAFGEVAAVSNFGGGADDMTVVTLNGAYGIGNWTLSGTLARQDNDSAGEKDLISLGADYEFANEVTLGAAVARIDDAGTRDTSIGVALIVPLGG
jgi:hypothetical protein